ncbi:laccase-11 [Hibiscus syriacus]|uniref:Laccase-11 n=1 Tax=Hibiscus syriacus TaxID=106335 RepID=A0A6A3B228_HIBSY|nr:mitochondrial acidic protein mam33-like [Hibiscus syriacus]KAE8711010.1 laccase-11 [Hibiscus syriacus]
MPRATQILRQSRKAVEDLNLLKVLRSEISQELSSNSFQDEQNGSLGDFVLEWNSSQSQDVVLRRKGESGEEVAVSALLSRETYYTEGIFPRKVLMKVCVKKPGLSSILQFHCGVFEKGVRRSDFNIHGAYLQSMTIPTSSVYRGPSFSTLDPQLQDELKEYLVARGIGEDLTNFLLLTLHKKEECQYLDWLQKLESFVAKDE